jgi:translation initiation factor 2-alpha kinase 4
LEGGFGIVYYLQDDTTSDGKYVIKVFKENVDYKAAEREIMLWSRLGYNKYIAEYFLWGRTYEDKLYILSKRYKYTLADFKHENICDKTIVKILSGIISGLYYANNKLGLIHRDIKPSNIFMDNDFNIKIGDFGLSTYINKKYVLSTNFDTIKEINQISQQKYGGTIPYMPPEILTAHNQEFCIYSDIFAIGVTAFNLLTNNNLPYILPSFNLNLSAWETFKKVNINQNIKKVIIKCLQMDKEKRYSNYEDMASDLNIVIDTNNEEDEVNSILNFIDTLFLMQKVQEAKDLINPLLEKYPNHPLLINKLAGYSDNQDMELDYYHCLFNNQKKYFYPYYFDPLFNYAGYYFRNRNISKMINIIDSNGELLENDVDYCYNNYKEYCAYTVLKYKDLKSIEKFINYLRRHERVSDQYLLVLAIYSFKQKLVSDVFDILKTYSSSISTNIIKILSFENRDIINESLSKLSIEIFGEIV